MGDEKDIEALRQAAAHCTACPLWRNATQTVFGEGDSRARCMLVGEQPGDQEDRRGHVFVGPAGAVLDRALEAAGLDRSTLYITNAVKHFKWQLKPRGKRRMHKTPAQREVDACHAWLERELATVRPQLVIALGSTAARALLGRGATVGGYRGRIVHGESLPALIVTVHPSFVLRVPHEGREAAFAGFVADLRAGASFLAQQ
jgi:uracil-DNA glycosylase